MCYGWWAPAASKAKPLMDANVRHEDPRKGLHDVRSFIGACNFYRRHNKNFTYTSAILTDLIKKSTTWRWGPQEQQAFDELKDKVANAKCLGVPRAEGEIILIAHTQMVVKWGPRPHLVLQPSCPTALSQCAVSRGFLIRTKQSW